MTSALRTPQVALVGHGHWGRNLARCLDQLGALATVIDPAPAFPVDMARGGKPSMGLLNDALSDPVIEAVAIATPARTHVDIAYQALQAGRHVFIEKPMALSVAAADHLLGAARAAQRHVMVGHLMRFHPAFEVMLAEIAAGRIGRLTHIHSRRLSPGKLRADENVLWSFAPHDISMVLALAGSDPDAVHCRGSRPLGNGNEDCAHVDLHFPGQLTAFIEVSWIHPIKEQTLIATGDKGALVLNDRATGPGETLMFHPHDISSTQRDPRLTQGDPVSIPVLAAEPLLREVTHFIDCLRSDKQPRTHGVEGRAVVSILQQAQQSMEMAE